MYLYIYIINILYNNQSTQDMDQLHHFFKFLYISLSLYLSQTNLGTINQLSVFIDKLHLIGIHVHLMYFFVFGNFEHSHSCQRNVWKFQALFTWGRLCTFLRGLSHLPAFVMAVPIPPVNIHKVFHPLFTFTKVFLAFGCL